MNLSKLTQILEKEPAYRLKQVKETVFVNLIEDWEQAKFLPKELRQKLVIECPLEIKGEIFSSKSRASLKSLITLEDGLKVEAVLMKPPERNTICVSSQVGCPLGCAFCATGKMGFKRNLTADEIVEQVVFFLRFLSLNSPTSPKYLRIVFMGMGEPFLNYDNVLSAIRILNDPDGLKIGARKISISTVGITEGIEKLANEGLEVNLAISLHAPENPLRTQIIPTNQKYPIEKILNAVNYYIGKTNRKVMFEYLMIQGINDSEEHAHKLAKLMKHKLYMVNLIAYNLEQSEKLVTRTPKMSESYNETGDFKPSSVETIKTFGGILEKEGINCTQRFKFGDDINAACGQLAGKA